MESTAVCAADKESVMRYFIYLFFLYALLCIAFDLRSCSVPLLVHLLFVLPGLIVFGNQLYGAFQAYALSAHRMAPDTLPDTSSAAL